MQLTFWYSICSGEVVTTWYIFIFDGTRGILACLSSPCQWMLHLHRIGFGSCLCLPRPQTDRWHCRCHGHGSPNNLQFSSQHLQPHQAPLFRNWPWKNSMFQLEIPFCGEGRWKGKCFPSDITMCTVHRWGNGWLWQQEKDSWYRTKWDLDVPIWLGALSVLMVRWCWSTLVQHLVLHIKLQYAVSLAHEMHQSALPGSQLHTCKCNCQRSQHV